MISWRIWVRDVRHRVLPRERVRELIVPALRSRSFQVDGGPDVIFKGQGTLPGEWGFSISDPRDYDVDTIKMMLSETLARTGFQLRKSPDLLNKPAGESTLRRLPVVRSSRA
jgi:hypothetical protein